MACFPTGTAQRGGIDIRSRYRKYFSTTPTGQPLPQKGGLFRLSARLRPRLRVEFDQTIHCAGSSTGTAVPVRTAILLFIRRGRNPPTRHTGARRQLKHPILTAPKNPSSNWGAFRRLKASAWRRGRWREGCFPSQPLRILPGREIRRLKSPAACNRVSSAADTPHRATRRRVSAEPESCCSILPRSPERPCCQAHSRLRSRPSGER